jgi:hypothetical protein
MGDRALEITLTDSRPTTIKKVVINGRTNQPDCVAPDNANIIVGIPAVGCSPRPYIPAIGLPSHSILDIPDAVINS